MDLPEDVVRYVERSFSTADRGEALAMLRSARLHDGTEAGPRLLRCAVVSSRRELNRLRMQVEHLAVDYRDVILEGEYTMHDGKPVRARNLNDPIPEDVQ